jgi:acyl-coenzyme A synthetase/AMP-(fatty) acid ligase
MTASEILKELRHYIDPVFLPRPLILLDALPRNAVGKLSRETLVKLAQPKENAEAADGT